MKISDASDMTPEAMANLLATSAVIGAIDLASLSGLWAISPSCVAITWFACAICMLSAIGLFHELARPEAGDVFRSVE
jgi:hypothetical protein